MFRVLKNPRYYFSHKKNHRPKGWWWWFCRGVRLSPLEKEEIKRRTRRRRARAFFGRVQKRKYSTSTAKNRRSGKVRRARNTIISNIWKFVQKATSLFFCKKRCLYIGVRIRTKSLGFKWLSFTQIELYKCFVLTRECFVLTLKFQCKSISQKKGKGWLSFSAFSTLSSVRASLQSYEEEEEEKHTATPFKRRFSLLLFCFWWSFVGKYL